MRLVALLDRGDFSRAAGLSDTEFQQYALAGLIPASAGFYNGQPLWTSSVIDDWCREHGLPPGAADLSPPPSLTTSEPSAAGLGGIAEETGEAAAASEPATEVASASDEPQEWMTQEQVCQRLSTVAATLQRRRDLGLLPRWKKDGRRFMYATVDVEAIYREHGKMPRHMSADGIRAQQEAAARARAGKAAKGSAPKVSKLYPLSGGGAQPLIEPKPVASTEKQVVKQYVEEQDAADHLGIPLLMLRILRKAQLGPKCDRLDPPGYRMGDLNEYSTRHGLRPGQIARADKEALDKRVRVPVACEILRMTPKALEHHRAKGTGPAWERQGIFSVYKTGDLFAYLVAKDEAAEEAWREQHARNH